MSRDEYRHHRLWLYRERSRSHLEKPRVPRHCHDAQPRTARRLAKVAQKGVLLKGDEEEDFAPHRHQRSILVTIGADSPEHYDSAYRHTAQIFRHLALEMDLPRHLIYTSSTPSTATTMADGSMKRANS